MAQSRLASAFEALLNVTVGYGVAVGTQVAIFPFFGVFLSLEQNLTIATIFTAVSLVRSYALRRLFERFTRPKRRAPAVRRRR